MKRFAKTILIALPIILLGLALFAVWLGGTEEGAKVFFRLVSRVAPVTIEARSVEGKLLGELRLGGMRVRLKEKDIHIEHLHLDWLPHGLLNGRLLVRELALLRVRVKDDSPPSEKEPGIAWPKVSESAARFEARIELLKVEDLVYRHREASPVAISGFSAAVGWRDGVLSLDNLAVSAPAGRVSGRLLAGLLRPSLRTDLEAIPVRPPAGIDRLSLHARLLPGRAQELISGTVSVSGLSGEAEKVKAAGEIGLTGTSVNFRRLRLTRPGRSGTLTGTGTLTITGAEPVLRMKAEIAGLDLEPELGVQTDITGRADFAGSRTAYRGDFAMRNRGGGWREGSVSAAFSGDGSGVRLTAVEGSLLDGTVKGTMEIGWREGITTKGAFQARRINPSRVDSRFRGVINADLAGHAERAPSGAIRGGATGTILDSIFQDEPFVGEIAADIDGKDVTVKRLAVRGKGFNVAAAGNTAKRLNFSAKVSDLAGLLPGSKGEFSADGWFRRRGRYPEGEVTGSGRHIAVAGLSISTAAASAVIGTGNDPSVTIRARLIGASFGQLAADSVTFDMDGTVGAHTLRSAVDSPDASVLVALQGGYGGKGWQGNIVRLQGRDAGGPWQLRKPAPLALSPERILLSDLELNGVGGERLRCSGDLALTSRSGRIAADWQELLLARVNPWLQGIELNGATSGVLDVNLISRERFTAVGELSAAGTLTHQGRRFDARGAKLKVDWREKGLDGLLQVGLADGGTLEGQFSSPSPPRFAVPAAGEADIRWSAVNTALLRPWLPAGMVLDGRLAGRVTAKLLPGKRFDMLGKTTLTGGTVVMENASGRLSTAIRALEATWAWREKGLRGGISLEMSNWGNSRGEFLLPVPARLPVLLDRHSPMQAHVTGNVRELGIITAFFPGLVQETHGEMAYDLHAGGTPAAPKLGGDLRLSKAGAYVPSAGIRISDLQLKAILANDRIIIETLRAVSGPGYLNASADIVMRDRKVVGYSGMVKGEKFEALNLPELRGLINPTITFSGTGEKAEVTGEVLVPELRVTGETPQAPVQPSKDVILTDAPEQERGRRLAVAVKVAIKLGEHVTVKAKGIDAQFGGGVELSGDDIDKLISKGEIKVLKGRYKAYGIDLEITRGRIFYAGGPLEEPTLDILALRTVEEVKAGVAVGGTVQAPTVKLYSEPSMPDVDIVAYMVLGHPLGQSGEQASLVSKAAGALLSAGQSVALQDQLKSRLGLSTLEVQTGGEKETGYMGYKPLTVGPSGRATPAASSGDISQTVLTVGKYLTPKLYVSYGRSLFTGNNLFRLRYDISRQWQIETQTGAESGADLYYKIDFE